MHRSSIEKMILFRDRYLAPMAGRRLSIFDLGSQDVNGSYRDILAREKWNYTGVDMASGKNVDVVLSDPYSWRSIASSSVDVVVSGQAFEHIRYFWITMAEIARVLRPGGFVCIIAPSSGPEHRYPVDCWRFYPDGMRAMADFAGLEVIEAVTFWDDKGYSDGSDWWHDSVLVARKPDRGIVGNFMDTVKLKVQNAVLTRGIK